MSFLLCAGCSRHIKSSEQSCPFCGAPSSLAPLAGNPSLVGSRARQRLLFGAASVVSTAVAGAAVIAGCTTTPDTSFVFMYGAPDVDAGAETGSGGPLYGSPVPEDAGGGTDAPLYGGPIFDSGGQADAGDLGDAADASDGD